MIRTVLNRGLTPEPAPLLRQRHRFRIFGSDALFGQSQLQFGQYSTMRAIINHIA
jgi:hypothetical protein